MISSRRRVVRSDTQSRPSIQILSRRGRLEFSPESEKTSMTSSSLDRTTLSAIPLLDWRWRKGESVPIGNFKKRAVRSFVRSLGRFLCRPIFGQKSIKKFFFFFVWDRSTFFSPNYDRQVVHFFTLLNSTTANCSLTITNKKYSETPFETRV